MRVLLGSGGFGTDERRALLVEEMRDCFGAIETILFVPYALADHDRYVRRLTELGLDAGYELVGIHRCDDPVLAIERAEAVYVGGGNSFRLIDAMHRGGLLEPLHARALDGMPFMGVSAGANVACPSIMTTNDMPIVSPPGLDALGLVPFQINTHYFAGHTFVRAGDRYHEHFGETRDERIEQFHEENETPVVGLWEGAVLRVEGDTLTLVGGGARLFRRGAAPVDFEPGSRMDELLRAAV